MTTPTFFEDEAGEWRAQLKAANGEIVYTSEGYRDRTDAERGLGDLYATVDAVRGRTDASSALGDLIDAMNDDFAMEVSRNSHVKRYVRAAIEALNDEQYTAYLDDWWLAVETGERHG